MDLDDTPVEFVGEGTDTVQSSIRWVLGNNLENLVLTGTASINGFGNGIANTLTGNSGANYLDGGAELDTLAGGAGNDSYALASTTLVNGGYTWDTVTEGFNAGRDTVYASADVGRYTYQLTANVEDLVATGVSAFRLWGNELNNSLTGNDAANEMAGFDGYDTFDGNGGLDILTGGAGNDIYILEDVTFVDEFTGYVYDTVVEAEGGGRDGVYVTNLGDDFYYLDANVEDCAVFGAYGLVVYGNTIDNALFGAAGDDRLESLGGNDKLNGGDGLDDLIGGDGDDHYVLDDATLVNGGYTWDMVSEAGSTGNDTVSASADVGRYTYTLTAGVENLVATGVSIFRLWGNELGNRLTGNAAANEMAGFGGADTLNGGAGADTMAGGLGNDVFYVDTNADQVVENAGEGYDRVLASRDFTLFTSAEIEMLTTSNSTGTDAIVLVGNTFTQTIVGNAGDNVLNSAGGGDTLRGLGGIDLYHVNSDDTVIENANGGTDTVNAHSNYVLAADANVEVLQSNDPGGTFARDLTGNMFAQTIVGGAGANRLHDGGKGAADILRGLGGDDTYVVYNAGDVIEDTAGNDRVLAGSSFALKAGVAIEMLTTTSGGGKGAFNLTGNELSQEIVGNAGENMLSSGAVGGVDMLRGLSGNDTYRLYNTGDIVVEAASQGSADRVMSSVSYALGADVYVELLTTNSSTATTAINLTGNALKQTITGNAGANVLSDGGAGKADNMRGLAGNDTYRVYNSGDVIVETSTQGAADRVMAAVDYRLGAGVHVELLTTNGASGKSAIDLTGNTFAQEILGNAGDNRLEGREGNDTLRGFGGDDTFVFNTKLGASNIDTVVDFNVADDRFLLSDAIFTKLNTGILASGYFRSNSTGLAQDANDHIIYETDTGELYYDSNGNAAGGSVLFAKVAVGLSLTNADFAVA